nr:serine/arginine repetitive matrix protein 1-like [Penaeus vannamei]
MEYLMTKMFGTLLCLDKDRQVHSNKQGSTCGKRAPRTGLQEQITAGEKSTKDRAPGTDNCRGKEHQGQGSRRQGKRAPRTGLQEQTTAKNRTPRTCREGEAPRTEQEEHICAEQRAPRTGTHERKQSTWERRNQKNRATKNKTHEEHSVDNSDREKKEDSLCNTRAAAKTTHLQLTLQVQKDMRDAGDSPCTATRDNERKRTPKPQAKDTLTTQHQQETNTNNTARKRTLHQGETAPGGRTSKSQQQEKERFQTVAPRAKTFLNPQPKKKQTFPTHNPKKKQTFPTHSPKRKNVPKPKLKSKTLKKNSTKRKNVPNPHPKKNKKPHPQHREKPRGKNTAAGGRGTPPSRRQARGSPRKKRNP